MIIEMGCLNPIKIEELQSVFRSKIMQGSEINHILIRLTRSITNKFKVHILDTNLCRVKRVY